VAKGKLFTTLHNVVPAGQASLRSLRHAFWEGGTTPPGSFQRLMAGAAQDSPREGGGLMVRLVSEHRQGLVTTVMTGSTLRSRPARLFEPPGPSPHIPFAMLGPE
jgi:hypothetical protein